MKKFFSIVLAIVATTTMAFAADPQTGVTVDCGKQVQISATPATGWHFVEWNDHNTQNPRVIEPAASAHYIATFAINQYTIIFKNEDGTELQNETLNHGDAVSYKGATPTKAPTAQYTYTFAGWNNSIVTPATDDATYTATFTSTVNKYTITFKNYDGSVLQSTQVAYGTIPTYTGSTPTKTEQGYTFTFTGWDKTLNPVTGEAEYIAQYSSQTNSYDINTGGVDENGNKVEGDGTYQYGDEVKLTAKPAECYKFVRWSDEPEGTSAIGVERTITVDGNKTYTAVFEKITYTITTAPDNTAHGSTTAVEL